MTEATGIDEHQDRDLAEAAADGPIDGWTDEDEADDQHEEAGAALAE